MIIAVIGNYDPPPHVYALAEGMGRELVRRGIDLVCGWLTEVMEVVAQGAKSEAAHVVIDGYCRNLLILTGYHARCLDIMTVGANVAFAFSFIALSPASTPGRRFPMSAKKIERTPVRVAPREVFIAEKRAIVAEYLSLIHI